MIPTRIIAMGASSVFGRVDPEGGGFIGRLKTWHEKQNRHNAVFNLGVGGDTTADLLKRFLPEATAKNRNPNLIIFSIGHNDTHRAGSKFAANTTLPSQFKENIKELIKQTKSLCDVMFVSIYPFDETKTQPLRETNYYYYIFSDTVNYAQITKEVCKNRQTPYLDIFNKFLQEGYGDLLYEDGLHFNAKGHEKIFIELKNFLLDLYS